MRILDSRTPNQKKAVVRDRLYSVGTEDFNFAKTEKGKGASSSFSSPSFSSSPSPSSEVCWGFCLLVCLTFGLASFLMFSAWGRFSGVAWGGAMEDEKVAAEGFITIEVTDAAKEPRLLRAAAAEASVQMPSDNANADSRQSARNENKENENQENSPGKTGSTLPRVSRVNATDFAQLPSEPTEDFGPLPRDLSDFESIILNAQDDGTQLPDSSTEDLSGIEPEAVQLAETGTVWKEHIVKTGETLSDIALSYGGLTARDILRANGLKDANRLATNQLLLIPNDPGKIEETLDEVRTRQMRVAAMKEKVQPLKVSAYVVAQGDSLWSISNAQNIELDTLVGCNPFRNSATLRPGAVLRIPNQDGIFYTMKKGEKIEDVCKRYGVNPDRLRQVNSTQNLAALKNGDEVFLPGARPDALVNVAKEKENNGKAAASKDSSKNAKTAQKNNDKNERERSEKIASLLKTGGRFYRWPVMGRINSPFGWRQHPITKRRDFHTGIDIKADRGTLIKGAREGKVVYSGWMGGYGKVLVIEHADGQSTLYAHCSTLFVPKGASVSQGESIARVGTTGRSTGPHLHFEVRSGNSPVNPLQFLK